MLSVEVCVNKTFRIYISCCILIILFCQSILICIVLITIIYLQKLTYFLNIVAATLHFSYFLPCVFFTMPFYLLLAYVLFGEA
jgi:hypothetical protein